MTDELDLVRRLRLDDESDVDRATLAREKSRLLQAIAGSQPRISSPPPGTPQIIPTLPYEDVLAAIDFLERAFGFREIEEARIETPGGIHAEMEIGAGRVMLGTPGGHGAFPPKSSGSPSLYLSVYIDDADAHCARARREGGRICAELEDKFYGDRVYEVFDLEGHRWSFHQHTGRRFPIDAPPPTDPEER